MEWQSGTWWCIYTSGAAWSCSGGSEGSEGGAGGERGKKVILYAYTYTVNSPIPYAVVQYEPQTNITLNTQGEGVGHGVNKGFCLCNGFPFSKEEVNTFFNVNILSFFLDIIFRH